MEIYHSKKTGVNAEKNFFRVVAVNQLLKYLRNKKNNYGT